MEKYKEEFIEFMVESNVLKFGDFVTKSGRKTPFFINTGNYTTGEQLKKLSELYNINVEYCSNRKEVKDHGEGGILLGGSLNDGKRVVIVEDVMTAGTSIYETTPILKAQGKVDIKGLIISVDRMEKGKSDKSAQEEIKEVFGITTYPIVTMKEVVNYLYNRELNGKIYIDDNMKNAIEDYYNKYGVTYNS